MERISIFVLTTIRLPEICALKNSIMSTYIYITWLSDIVHFVLLKCTLTSMCIFFIFKLK